MLNRRMSPIAGVDSCGRIRLGRYGLRVWRLQVHVSSAASAHCLYDTIDERKPGRQGQLACLVRPACAVLRGRFELIRLSEAFPQTLGAWLFHLHPLALLAMAVIAIALLWRWQQTRNAKYLLSGGSIIAVGLVWLIMAWMVVTPGERLRAALENILTAASHQDVMKIEGYIAPDAVLGDWDRYRIVSELNYRLAQVRLSANYLRSFHMRRRGRRAQTNITVLSIARDYGPFVTRWRLIWQDHPRPGNWQITQLQLQSIGSSEVSPRAPLGPSP